MKYTPKNKVVIKLNEHAIEQIKKDIFYLKENFFFKNNYNYKGSDEFNFLIDYLNKCIKGAKGEGLK